MSTLIQADDSWMLWMVIIGISALSIVMEQKYKWGARITGPILAMIGMIILTNLNIVPTDAPAYDMARAESEIEPFMCRLGRPGLHPKDVVREMQRLMAPIDVCILKTGRGLSRSLERLMDFKKNALPGMSASDPHYLVKCMEAYSMTLLTEMYLRSSLMRKESRAGHYRADFPERGGNVAWMALKEDRGEMEMFHMPVPLERYPVQPYRYYMDNFDFPTEVNAKIF